MIYPKPAAPRTTKSREPLGGAWQPIADAIRRRRHELGLTTEALAEYAGVSRWTVSNIEIGRPPQPAILLSLLESLGLELTIREKSE